jgi:hypothetical protein
MGKCLGGDVAEIGGLEVRREVVEEGYVVYL